MNLIWLIVLSAILGYLLLMLGPFIGGILAFAIVVGCLFKGLFLLKNISKRLPVLPHGSDSDAEKNVTVNYLKDRDVYLNYLKQKGK